MDPKLRDVLEISRSAGWVLEPYAKELFQAQGLPTTRFYWARTAGQVLEGARRVGYPLVAKVVSPDIVHKSDVGGVAVGIKGDGELEEIFRRFSLLQGFDGVLLDELVRGAEVIVGSKEDPQFGTVVMVGIGGTSVEIYKDVAIRMAPVTQAEALDAIDSLQGRKLLEGYRGREVIDKEALANLIVRFSETAYSWRDQVESMDLNPVLCAGNKAVIADARILLKHP
jgi:hypothetical protein